MLRTEVWKELRELDDLVQNITVTMPTGETFTYKEECARWEGQCFVNDILNLDKIMGEVSLASRSDHRAICLSANGAEWQLKGGCLHHGADLLNSEWHAMI